MDFLRFPTEIQLAILENLCLHCQMPRRATSIPNLETRRGRANKHAMSQLCLVSQYMKSLAQPILYHYFFSDQALDHNRVIPFKPKHFRGFVQTVQARSDLAMQVKLLTVVTPSLMDDAIESIAPLIYSNPAIYSGDSNVLDGALMDIVFDTLPNLEYLRYEKSADLGKPNWMPTKTLSKLRVLEQMFGIHGILWINEIEAEMPHFPKLETLNLLEEPVTDLPGVELSLGLRRIQLEVGTCWHVVSIIKHFPQLEDLDVMLYPHYLHRYQMNDASYQSPLWGRAGHTLRRLALSMELTPMPPFQLQGRLDLSLHSLGALQVLQIDHTLLYLQLKHHQPAQHDALSHILPPRLVKLHLTGIRMWPNMRRQLDDLVSAKGDGRLLHLTDVGIGPFYPQLDITREEMEHFQVEFNRVGIVWQEIDMPLKHLRLYDVLDPIEDTDGIDLSRLDIFQLP